MNAIGWDRENAMVDYYVALLEHRTARFPSNLSYEDTPEFRAACKKKAEDKVLRRAEEAAERAKNHTHRWEAVDDIWRELEGR